MNVSMMVGSRYSRSRSGNRFLSLVSLVSFFGLALGVMSLIIVVSVMNGFDRELKHRILGIAPHVIVPGQTPDAVAGWLEDFDVISVSPFKEVRVLMTTTRGSRLMSINGVTADDDGYLDLNSQAIELHQSPALADGGVAVVLGEAAARQLGVLAGDTIRIIIPKISKSGRTLRPGLVNATLTGTFEAGSEIEYSLALMDLVDVQQMTSQGADVKVMLQDPFDAPMAAARLKEFQEGTTDWTGQFGDFFDAVYMEKVMMFVLLSFVIAVASFSIVSGLSMMVDSKRRDIAVLRTMGMAEAGVMRIFLVQGSMIATSGILVGTALGIPLAYHVPEFMDLVYQVTGLSIIEGTYFSQIPTDVRLPDILAIVFVALAISFVATIYPSVRAARLNPAEILRYE